MNKKRIILLILVFIITIFSYSISNAKTTNTVITEEQYRYTIQNLLYPYIEEEVQKKYGYNAQVDIYDINIKSINIEPSSIISIVAIIKPYTGPHNTISTDKVNLEIEIGNVRITNYITIN